jgi:hypothetical protein
MSAINTGAIGLALWPGLHTIWGTEMKEHPSEFGAWFETRSSKMNSEELLSFVGLGLAGVKPEGQPVDFDTMRQGFRTRVMHVTYGLGYTITQEAIEDNLYKQIAETRTKALAKSLRVTRETNAALFLDRAFSNLYTFGDGLELCSTAHLNVSGGTYSNKLSTAADFSQAALEQALIDIGNFKDDRGFPAMVAVKNLVAHHSQKYEIHRVLNSPLQSNSAENAINVVRGVIPGGFKESHFVTDEDQWFLTTDASDGMIHFERRADDFDQDKDFTTRNLRYLATSRYSFTVGDPRSIYGSPGA